MILTAKNDSMRVKKVFVNGKDITNSTFKCRVPSKPGKIGLGWAYIFKRDKAGQIIRNWSQDGAPRGFRFGFIRWETNRELETPTK